jgi:hypothetical protein
VRLECGELHNSYHVNIPMTGHIESEHRGVRATADSEYATIPVNRATHCRRDDSCAFVMSIHR